jgi:voltage-gated potassium channel
MGTHLPVMNVDQRSIPRRFLLPGLFLLGTVIYGTIGYWLLIPRADPVDGLYWTVLTLGGVGYRDTTRYGAGYEAFSISLVVLLFVSVALFITVGTQLAASGDLTRRLRRRRVDKELSALDGHAIVCGYGRVGRAAVIRLLGEGREVAVVDNDPRHEDELVELGVPHLISEPEHEAVLRRMGIERAQALICAVDSDAVNVYITITGRTLRPDLTIVARAADSETIDILERAGADSVVSPYIISGGQMAELAGQRRPAR